MPYVVVHNLTFDSNKEEAMGVKYSDGKAVFAKRLANIMAGLKTDVGATDVVQAWFQTKGDKECREIWVHFTGDKKIDVWLGCGELKIGNWMAPPPNSGTVKITYGNNSPTQVYNLLVERLNAIKVLL